VPKLQVIFPAILIALVLAAIVHQLRGWSNGTIVVSSKQKGLRYAEAVCLLIVLVMILVNNYWPTTTPSLHAIIILTFYWAVCLLITGILAILAMLDIHETNKRWQEERTKHLRDMLTGPEDDGKDGKA